MHDSAAAPAAGALAVAVPLFALVYFLLAPGLPALPDQDSTVLVAGGAGLILLAASVLVLVPSGATAVKPALIALAAGLVAAAMNVAGAGAAANVVEALAAGALGLLLARLLGSPAVAVAVPLFAGAIDLVATLSGPSSAVLEAGADHVDGLSLDLPAWGDAGSAGQLGVTDALFLAMFAAWAWRFGLRPVATMIGLVAGLLASLVLGVALDRAVPALPLMAAGYLLPNLDRLPALVRGGSGP